MKVRNSNYFFVPSMVAIACMAMSGTSRADTPLSLTVSEELTYDTNVFRDNTNKRRDTVSNTGVQVGLKKDYGRQSYKASGTVVAKRYKDTKEYNNDGYSMNLGISSSFLSNWYASADYSNVKQQQNPEDQGRARYLETINAQSSSVFLQYGLYGRWSVNGTLNNDKVTYDVQDFNDRDSVAYRFGLRYSPTDLIYIDTSVQRSEVNYDKYRVASGLGTKTKRTDYDLTARWIITGYSQLNGRVGWTQERNDKDSRRDYNGLTGRVAWVYTPAGKMTYSLAVDRDTNNAGGFTGLQFSNFSSYTSQNRVSTGLTFNASWQATGKVSLDAGLSYRKTREEITNNITDGNISDVTGSGKANGKYDSMSLGIKYQALRSLVLSCNVQKYNRSQSILTAEFDGEAANCSAVFSID